VTRTTKLHFEQVVNREMEVICNGMGVSCVILEVSGCALN